MAPSEPILPWMMPIAGLGVLATPVAARLISRSGPRPALVLGWRGLSAPQHLLGRVRCSGKRKHKQGHDPADHRRGQYLEQPAQRHEHPPVGRGLPALQHLRGRGRQGHDPTDDERGQLLA
jgi:hypothetical protein